MAKINTDLPEFIYLPYVSALIDKIEEHKEDSEVYWNSWGGSTGAGQVFIDYIGNREFETIANVSGFAASMGASILPYFSKVIGSEQADVMIHAASGGEASTLEHTNKFLYESLAKKIDEDKFEKITGHNLKNVFLGTEEQRVDVWFTGKQAKQMGLFDESYNLLDKAARSSKVNESELPYILPENISNKYNKKVNKKTVNDMDIKDVTAVSLKTGNASVYKEIGESEKKAEQLRIKSVLKYYEFDPVKANEIIDSGNELSVENVEHFMEKKYNAKKISDLEDDSQGSIDPSKQTKDKEDVKLDSELKAEKSAILDDLGLNYKEK